MRTPTHNLHPSRPSQSSQSSAGPHPEAKIFRQRVRAEALQSAYSCLSSDYDVGLARNRGCTLTQRQYGFGSLTPARSAWLLAAPSTSTTHCRPCRPELKLVRITHTRNCMPIAWTLSRGEREKSQPMLTATGLVLCREHVSHLRDGRIQAAAVAASSRHINGCFRGDIANDADEHSCWRDQIL